MKQASWFVYFWCPFQPASATFICFTNGLRPIPWPNIRILASIWYSHNSPLLLSDDPHVWHSLPSSVQALSYSSSMAQCRSLLRTKKTGDPPLSLICLLLTFVLGRIHANKTLARFMNPTGLWCIFLFSLCNAIAYDATVMSSLFFLSTMQTPLPMVPNFSAEQMTACLSRWFCLRKCWILASSICSCSV